MARDNKILILEDSRTFSGYLSILIRKKLGLESIVFSRFQDFVKRADEFSRGINICICDIHLPDVKADEHIDFLIERGISVIVVTAEFNFASREEILNKKKIVDYVIKDRKEEMDYLLYLISRLHRNPGIKVVIADDSLLQRRIMKDFLSAHLFQVSEVKNGIECLELIQKEKNVKLVITDYNMPGMDGMELTIRLREKFPKEKLGIIALSSGQENNTPARFLKAGASDFLLKPFSKEEFYCRINTSLDVLLSFEKISRLANYDFLTGLVNRRYFFEKLERSFRENHYFMSIAILDVDFFKKINDTFGHESGDTVLKVLSGILKESLEGKGFAARFGGEEFVIVTESVTVSELFHFYEDLRIKISETEVRLKDGRTVRFTASMGAVPSYAERRDSSELLREADRLLYEAKKEGRNRVILSV